jgi:hypothetical protein
MTPIAIRPALASDIAAILPLFEELDEHHRHALPAVFRKPTGARREQSWLDWLIAGPDQTILVAEGPDADVIGLVVLVARSAAANTVRDATICGNKPAGRAQRGAPPRRRTVTGRRVQNMGPRPRYFEPRGLRMVIQRGDDRILPRGRISADRRMVRYVFPLIGGTAAAESHCFFEVRVQLNGPPRLAIVQKRVLLGKSHKGRGPVLGCGIGAAPLGEGEVFQARAA